MIPAADDCYRAMLAHDRRFDGVFFVGVTSTGIYCRPVCTVRPPKRENCRFFAHAAGAEVAGFRPCLRCRPELAPGRASVDAVEELAREAASRIEAGALADGESLETLAEGLEVSSRHLRRVVRQCYGVSPVELAQTQRLLTAKRLLTDTRLPVTEIALASGFRSLRRFHALFRARYGLAPSRWRQGIEPAGDERIVLGLGYRPPFAWEALLEYLRKRLIPGVERVTAEDYARTVAIRGHRGWLRVWHAEKQAMVKLELSASLLPVLPEAITRVRALFDLDADPAAIGARLAADPLLAPMVAREPGLRVPGAFDGFEAAVRTILGQQVTVAAATTLMGRLTREFAEPAETPFDGLDRWPVSAAALAQVDPSRLGELGVIRQRIASILAVAKEVTAGSLRLAPGSRPSAAIRQLQTLPGIGPWTAHYLAMRVLRWPDAFPAADLGVRIALGRISAKEAEVRSAVWSPWRSYAVLHLWQSLAAAAAATGTGTAPIPSRKSKATTA